MLPIAQFKVDHTDLDRLATGFHFTTPKSFAFAFKSVLNDQAFATMRTAKGYSIPHFFHVRSQPFLSKVIRVRPVIRAPFKALSGTGFMTSEVGAILTGSQSFRESAIGLAQLEFGKQGHGRRIYSILSRGGAFANSIRSAFRGKKNVPEAHIEVRQGNPIIAGIRKLEREGYKGAFFIRGFQGAKKGIYKFGRQKFRTEDGHFVRRLEFIKQINPSPVSLPTRPWLLTATRKAVTAETTNRFFRNAAIKHLEWLAKKK